MAEAGAATPAPFRSKTKQPFGHTASQAHPLQPPIAIPHLLHALTPRPLRHIPLHLVPHPVIPSPPFMPPPSILERTFNRGCPDARPAVCPLIHRIIVARWQIEEGQNSGQAISKMTIRFRIIVGIRNTPSRPDSNFPSRHRQSELSSFLHKSLCANGYRLSGVATRSP